MDLISCLTAQLESKAARDIQKQIFDYTKTIVCKSNNNIKNNNIDTPLKFILPNLPTENVSIFTNPISAGFNLRVLQVQQQLPQIAKKK